MTDKKEIKKYCSGIDCLTCGEAEPCIYRIANKLQEQLKRKEEECEELKQWKKGAENLFKAQIGNPDKIINRYKQALDEIKPILEFYANSNMGEEQPDKTYHIMLNGSYIMVYDPKPARQALQKISEVKNE